jgi:hypothetical protein
MFTKKLLTIAILTLLAAFGVADSALAFNCQAFDQDIENRTTGPVPLGVQPIDAKRLIPSCKDAQALPPGFPLAMASGSLYWPVYPGAEEPFYVFSVDGEGFRVGAYSGRALD